MAEPHVAVGRGLPAPVIFGATLLIGFVLNWAAPRMVSSQGMVRLIGWLLAIFGVVGIGLPALAALRRAGTSPHPERPTTALVVTGPYRFSRHPIYVSMAVIYAGLALAANDFWALLLWPIALSLTDRGPMTREERYMERRFGDAYRDYEARVRRWI